MTLGTWAWCVCLPNRHTEAAACAGQTLTAAAVLTCANPPAGAKTFHLTLNADRGVSWEAALASREAAAKELTDAGRPLSGAAGFWVDQHVGARGQGQTG